MEKELRMLSTALDKPAHPFVAIIGGAKVSDKIAVIENLLTKADHIIIGGAMAYTFLKAQDANITIGKSRFQEEYLEFAKKMLAEANGKIVLPIDHAISTDFADNARQVTEGVNIPEGYMALDLGPKSIELYANTLKNARTVV